MLHKTMFKSVDSLAEPVNFGSVSSNDTVTTNTSFLRVGAAQMLLPHRKKAGD